MNTEHDQTVSTLQRQISDYYQRKVPFRIYHGSTNATRVVDFKRSEMIDTSHLNHVLTVDTRARTVRAESNVPMDKLLDATLPHGLMPPVVTEFPGITVGGAIQGGAIESGSFRWGAFSQTVLEVEMILADGTFVKASPTNRSDLFYGAAGSYGSLGVVVAATIKLIPAKQYVQIKQIPVSSFKEALDLTETYTKSDCDFIEAGMFRKDRGSVVVGTLSDTVVGSKKYFSRAWNDWYYLYIKRGAFAGKTIIDTVPLKDYLFRYDRGAFWAAQLAFDQSGLPFNAATRFILNPLLKTRKLYQAVQESAAAQRYICQDIVLPHDGLVPFMEYMDKAFAMYPTGFCAVKADVRSPLQFNAISGTEQTFNVGIYGLRIEPYEKFVEANKQIEAKTRELGGRKWFYAHSYYTEQEFWEMYNKKWYESLRKKYNATSLPDIYERTRVKSIYKIDTKKAALKTLLGRAKIRMSD